MNHIEETATEVRASELRQGDTYVEDGMFDVIKVRNLKYHGDTVLVTGTKGEKEALDVDTVVMLLERKGGREPA